jgi:hypothetical protein
MKKEKVYCLDYNQHAGKWIYDGYQSAWEHLGYELQVGRNSENSQTTYSSPIPTNSELLSEEYYMMSVASLFEHSDSIKALQHSKKSFLFVQPKVFPEPWGKHPNYVCNLEQQWVDEISKLDNIILWTFTNVSEEGQQKYFTQWGKKIHTFPLAFDHINYKPQDNQKMKQFDICFVGGWADNGFNEKRKIILDIFKIFMETDLKCGFFVNKNLTHQQECDLLANSKLTLNIHDAYQRVLGLDTNERTFKSLGLNGLMVSDTVEQLNQIFPDVRTSLEPKQLVEITKEILAMPENDREELRQKNKDDILKNHTYVNRVQEMLKI